MFVPVADVKVNVGLGHDVVQLTVSGGTHPTPLAVIVKTTTCPGVKPETVKLDGEI